jgi:hypothetical protein
MYLQQVLSKTTFKKLIFCWYLISHGRKKAGTGSGSVSEWYGSADPDPYQNASDPEQCVYISVC